MKKFTVLKLLSAAVWCTYEQLLISRTSVTLRQMDNLPGKWSYRQEEPLRLKQIDKQETNEKTCWTFEAISEGSCQIHFEYHTLETNLLQKQITYHFSIKKGKQIALTCASVC